MNKPFKILYGTPKGDKWITINCAHYKIALALAEGKGGKYGWYLKKIVDPQPEGEPCPHTKLNEPT